jgi:protein-tyrosine phosphatase
MTVPGSPSTFAILFVCTGNICRSPFAELVTRHLLAERLRPDDAARFAVGSAGTHAFALRGMDPLTRAELTRWGVDGVAAAGHVSRLLDGRTAGSANLILTAERWHRAHAVSLCPSALRYTFCLREFCRLLAGVGPGPAGMDPVTSASAAVTAAARHRGMVPPVTAADDAVADPFGGLSQVHHATATAIGTLVREIVEFVAVGGTRSTVV